MHNNKLIRWIKWKLFLSRIDLAIKIVKFGSVFRCKFLKHCFGLFCLLLGDRRHDGCFECSRSLNDHMLWRVLDWPSVSLVAKAERWDPLHWWVILLFDHHFLQQTLWSFLPGLFFLFFFSVSFFYLRYVPQMWHRLLTLWQFSYREVNPLIITVIYFAFAQP